jgi:hypothetical protein
MLANPRTLGDCLDDDARRELGLDNPRAYATLGDYLDANPMRFSGRTNNEASEAIYFGPFPVSVLVH